MTYRQRIGSHSPSARVNCLFAGCRYFRTYSASGAPTDGTGNITRHHRVPGAPQTPLPAQVNRSRDPLLQSPDRGIKIPWRDGCDPGDTPRRLGDEPLPVAEDVARRVDLTHSPDP